MSVRRLGVAIAMLCLATASAAQSPAPAASPRTLVGLVADTAGNPIDSADVTIASLKRREVSGVDGVFRFDKIDPGTYDVSVRRFGYGAQTRRVIVGPNGGTVRFRLTPVPHALPPVISSVLRGGLSGVIGDTAFNIVEGAAISVIASDHRTTSDSLGKFFIDLHPGRYMVRVTRDGFIPRLVSVTIPNDSGRRMAVWLVPGSSAQSAVDSWMLDGLNDRLLVRKPSSRIFTREDINNSPMTELTQLTLMGGGIQQRDDCPAFIDGGPRTAPLWSISAAEIETVEVYPPGSLPLQGASSLRYQPTTSMRGNAPIRAQTQSRSKATDECPVLVYVWMRK